MIALKCNGECCCCRHDLAFFDLSLFEQLRQVAALGDSPSSRQAVADLCLNFSIMLDFHEARSL